jgi:hypothetical protein
MKQQTAKRIVSMFETVTDDSINGVFIKQMIEGKLLIYTATNIGYSQVEIEADPIGSLGDVLFISKDNLSFLKAIISKNKKTDIPLSEIKTICSENQYKDINASLTGMIEGHIDDVGVNVDQLIKQWKSIKGKNQNGRLRIDGNKVKLISDDGVAILATVRLD